MILGWLTVALTFVTLLGCGYWLASAWTSSPSWQRRPPVPRIVGAVYLSSGADYVGPV